METANRIEEILTERGLNWTVNQETMQTASGIVIPDKMAMVRSDNNAILGINGDGYCPYQNHEMLELMFRMANQSGLEVHSGGSFGGGQKVFFQLKGSELKIGTDKVKGFFTTFNSFDGTASLGVGNSSITVSCLNTFWAGYSAIQNKIRHTTSMRPKIEEMLRQLEIAVSAEGEIFTKIKRISEVQIDAKVKQLVIDKLFDLAKEEKLADISTAKQNKMARFYLDLNGELQTKGETLWGLFSGVTKYTTHSMKNGKDNTEGKIFGAIGNKERQIWEMVTAMV